MDGVKRNPKMGDTVNEALRAGAARDIANAATQSASAVLSESARREGLKSGRVPTLPPAQKPVLSSPKPPSLPPELDKKFRSVVDALRRGDQKFAPKTVSNADLGRGAAKAAVGAAIARVPVLAAGAASYGVTRRVMDAIPGARTKAADGVEAVMQGAVQRTKEMPPTGAVRVKPLGALQTSDGVKRKKYADGGLVTGFATRKRRMDEAMDGPAPSAPRPKPVEAMAAVVSESAPEPVLIPPPKDGVEMALIQERMRAAGAIGPDTREARQRRMKFMAGGGKVVGPGGPRDDKVPAMLSNGEYVMPADTVKRVGVQALDAIRGATHQRGIVRRTMK